MSLFFTSVIDLLLKNKSHLELSNNLRARVFLKPGLDSNVFENLCEQVRFQLCLFIFQTMLQKMREYIIKDIRFFWLTVTFRRVQLKNFTGHDFLIAISFNFYDEKNYDFSQHFLKTFSHW